VTPTSKYTFGIAPRAKQYPGAAFYLWHNQVVLIWSQTGTVTYYKHPKVPDVDISNLTVREIRETNLQELIICPGQGGIGPPLNEVDDEVPSKGRVGQSSPPMLIFGAGKGGMFYGPSNPSKSTVAIFIGLMLTVLVVGFFRNVDSGNDNSIKSSIHSSAISSIMYPTMKSNSKGISTSTATTNKMTSKVRDIIERILLVLRLDFLL